MSDHARIRTPEKLTDEAVKEHFRLVHKLALKYSKTVRDASVSYEDLFSEGCIGLIKALESYDPSKGFSFSTYAHPTISGHILRFLSRIGTGPIRYPNHSVLLANKILRAGLDNASPVEIHEKLKAPLSHIEQALEYLKKQILSLDKSLREKDGRDMDEYGQLFAITSDDLSEAFVNEFLDYLPPNKRRILELRLRGYNGREIAKDFNVTYQAIFNQMDSIKKLYKRFEMRKVGSK